MFGMLLAPGRTFDRIAAEPPSARTLILRYAAPLAAIPAVCEVIGAALFGFNVANIGVRMSALGLGLGAVAGFLVTFPALWLAAGAAARIAGAFGGERDRDQALRLVTYSATAPWAAGLAQVYPTVGFPVAILASIYGFHALYKGLHRLMRVPQDRQLTAFAALLLVVLALLWTADAVASAAAELGGPLSASYAPM